MGKKLIITAALALALLPAGAMSDAGCGGTWWVTPGALTIGAQLPTFGFNTCDGEQVTTDQLQGQPTLINFWATWCPPCLAEMPQFAAAAVELGENVNIVGISVDTDAQTVREFVDAAELPYPLTWDGGGIADGLGIYAIPVTVAVNDEGRVMAVHQGYASPEDLETLLKAAEGDQPEPQGNAGGNYDGLDGDDGACDSYSG